MIRELVVIERNSTLITKKEEIGQPQSLVYNSVVLNFNEVGMDHLCTFHQEHHSKKTYP